MSALHTPSILHRLFHTPSINLNGKQRQIIASGNQEFLLRTAQQLSRILDTGAVITRSVSPFLLGISTGSNSNCSIAIGPLVLFYHIVRRMESPARTIWLVRGQLYTLFRSKFKLATFISVASCFSLSPPYACWDFSRSSPLLPSENKFLAFDTVQQPDSEL